MLNASEVRCSFPAQCFSACVILHSWINCSCTLDLHDWSRAYIYIKKTKKQLQSVSFNNVSSHCIISIETAVWVFNMLILLIFAQTRSSLLASGVRTCQNYMLSLSVTVTNIDLRMLLVDLFLHLCFYNLMNWLWCKVWF